jgi:two-component system response regulator FixJ
VTFESGREFLDYRQHDSPGCLILDLQLPGLNGIELQKKLTANHVNLPIVFMSGHGDIPTTVDAIRHGAVDFLPKPVNDEKLLDVVRRAVEQHAKTRHVSAELRRFRKKVDSLTNREHQVMMLVITGMMNKHIAGQLGITETTVKVHRGRMIEKTGVESVAELVLLCERCGLTQSTK